MKSTFLLSLVLFVGFASSAQDKNLLGIQPLSALQSKPYSEWFEKGYNEYVPQPTIVQELKNISKKNLQVKVFFGSWCGDTKRELPKFIKVLQQSGFQDSQIELIGLDNDSKTYKQSPQHEESIWNIYRVPTFIVLKNGIELNRIVEYPAFSFERDLLLILQNKTYQPNYAGYQQVGTWLANGLLADGNVNARGLANALRGKIHQDSELNAVGYVLIGQNKMTEAINILQINTHLFPKVANCYDSLAEAYLLNGQKEAALWYYEYALKLDPESKSIKEAIEGLKSDKK